MTGRDPQLPLFSSPQQRWENGDPRAPAEEVHRLSRQCQAILDRLRLGPASNSQLARIALNYRGRIHDLRRAGVQITTDEQPGGLTVYCLIAGKADPGENDPGKGDPHERDS